MHGNRNRNSITIGIRVMSATVLAAIGLAAAPPTHQGTVMAAGSARDFSQGRGTWRHVSGNRAGDQDSLSIFDRSIVAENIRQLQRFVNTFSLTNNGNAPYYNVQEPKTIGTPRVGYASEIDLNAVGRNGWTKWSATHKVKLVTDPAIVGMRVYYGMYFDGVSHVVFATTVRPEKVYGNDDQVGNNEGSTGSGDWIKNVWVFALDNNRLRGMHLAQVGLLL